MSCTHCSGEMYQIVASRTFWCSCCGRIAHEHRDMIPKNAAVNADLLAALEAVAADYGITLQPVPCELTGSDLHSTAIRLLRAAYAKATQPGA